MSITAAQAQTVINGALAKGKELGTPVTIVVVDSGGDVSAIGRMDGAGGFNFDLAYGLAYTSASFSATGAQLDGIKDENWFRAASTMRGGRFMVGRAAAASGRPGDRGNRSERCSRGGRPGDRRGRCQGTLSAATSKAGVGLP